jgi:hypothetical protein
MTKAYWQSPEMQLLSDAAAQGVDRQAIDEFMLAQHC